MAKHGRRLPARKPREEESLLIRSAESLGRMIGSLQRQLDAAARKANGHSARPVAKRKKTTTTTKTSARARKAAKHG